MRIARDGTWFYNGSPIGRKELVCLFASVLRREQDGEYWLVTPAEMGRIEVEDAPFVAVELFFSGKGREQVLSFRTNIDGVVTAGPRHKLAVRPSPVTGEPTPYIMLRDRLEARINRAVYYELVALGQIEVIEGEALFGVWSAGLFFRLGRAEDVLV
ncbi:MAG: DUF1285 domain-containing protein [Alphaproteobacteria bacterium]|nr:DUF1285 domain-containing protein [Alphaproteobacteria bacterium]